MAIGKIFAMLQLFQKYNPVRSRCWRLDRVLQLIENQPFPRQPSRMNDDRYIRAYYYLLLENRCTDWKNSTGTLSCYDPALVQAHLLRWSLDAEDRAIVEARILAGETDAEIGRKRGIMPAAVDWYEGLFFCVRDRLECSDWIRNTIQEMGGEKLLFGKDNLNEQQRHTVYRLFGYYHGADMLDATIHTFSPRPLKAEDCPDWIDDALRTSIRAAAMAAVAKFNKTNIHLLFQTALKIIKQRRSSDISTVDVTKNIEALVDNLRCLVDLPDGNPA